MNSLTLILFTSLVVMIIGAPIPSSTKTKPISDTELKSLQEFGKELKKSIMKVETDVATQVNNVIKKHDLKKLFNQIQDILQKHKIQDLFNDLAALAKNHNVGKVVDDKLAILDENKWNDLGNDLLGVLKKYKLGTLMREVNNVFNQHKMDSLPGELYNILDNLKVESPLKEIVEFLSKTRFQDLGATLGDFVKKLHLEGLVKAYFGETIVSLQKLIKDGNTFIKQEQDDLKPLMNFIKKFNLKDVAAEYNNYIKDNEITNEQKLVTLWSDLRQVLLKVKASQLNGVMKFLEKDIRDFLTGLKKIYTDLVAVHNDVMKGLDKLIGSN